MQTEGYGAEDESEEGGEQQDEDDAGVGAAGAAEAQVVVGDVATFGEEVGDEFAALGAEEGDGEGEEGCQQRYERDFEDRVGM